MHLICALYTLHVCTIWNAYYNADTVCISSRVCMCLFMGMQTYIVSDALYLRQFLSEILGGLPPSEPNFSSLAHPLLVAVLVRQKPHCIRGSFKGFQESNQSKFKSRTFVCLLYDVAEVWTPVGVQRNVCVCLSCICWCAYFCPCQRVHGKEDRWGVLRSCLIRLRGILQRGLTELLLFFFLLIRACHVKNKSKNVVNLKLRWHCSSHFIQNPAVRVVKWLFWELSLICACHNANEAHMWILNVCQWSGVSPICLCSCLTCPCQHH